MKQYLEQLKLQAETNPLGAAAVGAAVIIAITKLLSATTDRQKAKTWDREVERRRMNIR
jgi:Cys-tRNA synthase (O-phospho-L-seryl-tRNA:Cys-tRNA synthase)